MDGSSHDGLLLIPIGMEFEDLILNAPPFIEFMSKDGEKSFININAVQQVIRTAEKAEEAKEEERRKRDEETAARKEAGKGYAQGGEDKAANDQDKDPKKEDPPKPKRRAYTVEQYAALDMLKLNDLATKGEIQAAYRKMAKTYHPDRLRGLGVAEDKIEYAARRLAEINTAYRLLMKAVTQDAA